MERISPRTLSGFMELSPENQVRFDKMVEILRESFSLYGFTPLDTPVIEAAEVLLAKGSGETEKQIYRFTKGENDLALRFDLTVPLAKYAALHYGRLVFPFRRFQIGKVYRGERAQRGRFREFYQADIDVIGDGALAVINEAEIPGVICQSFQALGLSDFVIRLNNRKVLNGLFAAMDLTEQSGAILRTVDKLEKIGQEKTAALLVDDLGIQTAQADRLLDVLTCSSRGTSPIRALAAYSGKNPLLDEGIEELFTVARHMEDFGVPNTHFKVDLTIARGLDYYTGTVYETIIPDQPEIGSICGGGRYDNLAGHYTDRKLPGVGVSIGLTRLFYVLEEQRYLNEALLTAPADVLILPMTEDLETAIAFATAIRRIGIRAQIYGEEKRFKGKLAYADKLGIPYAVFIGEDELAAGKVTVKDMVTGEQETVSARAAAERIGNGVAARRGEKPIKQPKRR